MRGIKQVFEEQVEMWQSAKDPEMATAKEVGTV